VTAAAPTLVVLAAGMGSRYGGLKQLEGVGPPPERATLMEYSLFDARRAGFGDVVFVIRPDMEAGFRDYASRFGSRVRWATAIQEIESGRSKPWGTAQAVLAAEPAVHGPFAVLNADDFYGAAAFAAIADFLAGVAPGGLPTFALAGYRLMDTLSDAGAVNRGYCRSDRTGWLKSIEEVTGLARTKAGGYEGQGVSGRVTLEGTALVSMSLWAFTPDVFPLLRDAFTAFRRTADQQQDELLLPAVIQEAVGRGAARVRVLDPKSQWWGITHPGDRPKVEAALARVVALGSYPSRLWG
jgi:hypothetical protein